MTKTLIFAITMLVLTLLCSSLSCSSDGGQQAVVFDMMKYKIDCSECVDDLSITDIEATEDVFGSEFISEQFQNGSYHGCDLSALSAIGFKNKDIDYIYEEQQQGYGPKIVIVKGDFKLNNNISLLGCSIHKVDGYEVCDFDDYFILFINDLIIWSDSEEALGSFISVLDHKAPSICENDYVKAIMKRLPNDPMFLRWEYGEFDADSYDELILSAATAEPMGKNKRLLKGFLYFESESRARHMSLSTIQEDAPMFSKISYHGNIVEVSGELPPDIN